MKKRALIFGLIFALTLAMFVPLSFADSECEHSYTKDGDCTTPDACSLCASYDYYEASHKFDKATSYSYDGDSFLSSGKKTLACSNSGCTKTVEADAKPLVDSLGYSIREFLRNDYTYYSLSTSYVFNANEIKAYADYLGCEYEYGIICYLPSLIGDDQPVSGAGNPDVTVLKINYTGLNGVRDLTLPSIICDSASDEFVFSAYVRFGSDVYYVQSDNVITDYKELGIVSAALVLDKLKNAQ